MVSPSTTHTVMLTLTQSQTVMQTVIQKQTVVQTMNRTVTTSPSASTVTLTQAEPCVGQPVWTVNSTAVPVLLMRPNSTGFVCVTYLSAWEGNANNYSRMPLEPVWNYAPPELAVAKWSCAPGVSNGNDCINGFYSNVLGSLCLPASHTHCYHSFVTSASPQSTTVGSATRYVDVLYTIRALSNSTGFYDESAPYEYCEQMPLAVGYTASQVNASDFTILSRLCPFLYFTPYTVSDIGMNFTTIKS